MVNYDKSDIAFSKGVNGEMRQSIKQFLQVKEVAQFPKYLGMPTVIGRSEKVIFKFLKERVAKRINGWKEKLLSKAGRETLIKAVAKAIPIFIMSCFSLTSSFCYELQQLIANYWRT